MYIFLFDPAACQCWIGGDPHYSTFDQRAYDNQAACKYMGSYYKNPGDPCEYAFEEKNIHLGSRSVSFLAVVDLKILGHTVRFTRAGQIWVSFYQFFYNIIQIS